MLQLPLIKKCHTAIHVTYFYFHKYHGDFFNVETCFPSYWINIAHHWYVVILTFQCRRFVAPVLVCQIDFPMLEILHGWYGKLLSPILVYYLGLPMLESFIPILAYHLCLTTIGWLNTNIGIPFLFDQHWILLYQYWLTIFVWPTLDDSIPILAYHLCLTNIGWLNTNIGISFLFDQCWDI